ncbi:transposase [Akkermansiaceae bacterium]|nr:transposase [Akkermansiaceae bacterium]
MPAKFVCVDHDTPLLLPPDLRDWLQPGHMVHFIMDAVAALDLSAARVNERGTGSAQYPPTMMLGLLIYCYATGTFSSRRIETLTYENVAVRYLCADHHPDHDSICKFRRENREMLASVFHQVLELATTAGLLQVGHLTVAVDGTKLLANASKHHAMSHGHLEEQMKLAQEQIQELLAKAEDADSTPLEDGLSIPEEIKRREDRLAKLQQAKQVMEERARKRFEEEQAEHEQKLARREAKEKSTAKKPGGRPPKPPTEGPRPKDQYNFTDPESRIMKDGGSFEQCYNAQAAVEVDTMLVVGGYVSDAPNDKEQLVPALGSVSPVVGKISDTLVDSGYYSEAAVIEVEKGGEGPTVYAAVERQGHGRSVTQLEKCTDPPPPPPEASVAQRMAHRLATKAGQDLYRLRKQSVEPVFGIIKEVMGFRRFSMRGLEKVNLEWSLVSLSYNCKRLFNLGLRIPKA